MSMNKEDSISWSLLLDLSSRCNSSAVVLSLILPIFFNFAMCSSFLNFLWYSNDLFKRSLTILDSLAPRSNVIPSIISSPSCLINFTSARLFKCSHSTSSNISLKGTDKNTFCCAAVGKVPDNTPQIPHFLRSLMWSMSNTSGGIKTSSPFAVLFAYMLIAMRVPPSSAIYERIYASWVDFLIASLSYSLTFVRCSIKYLCLEKCHA